jgi:hypothetical protein
MATAEPSETAREILVGAVDTHVHSAPDQIARWGTDPEVARAAVDAGMAGAVVKSHVVPTMDRAAVTNELLDTDVLHGGVALNGAVGGVNPEAVAVALNQGATVVWLPTVWNAHHAAIARNDPVDVLEGFTVPSADDQIPVVEDGEVTDDVRAVIDLVAERDAVLGTGHSSPDAVEAVAEAGADAGASVVVTHPFFEVVDLSIDRQERLAELGATLEFCAFSLENTPDHSVERVVEAVERIGADACVLATDYGQTGNPPVGGLAGFVDAVLDAGLDRPTVERLVRDTPRRLLGL